MAVHRVFNIVLYHRDERIYYIWIYMDIYCVLFVHYAFIVANETFYNIEISSLCHRAAEEGLYVCSLLTPNTLNVCTGSMYNFMKWNRTNQTNEWTNDRTRIVCAQLTTHTHAHSMPQSNEIILKKYENSALQTLTALNSVGNYIALEATWKQSEEKHHRKK